MDDQTKADILRHFDIIFPATMQSRSPQQDGWKDDYWRLFQCHQAVTESEMYDLVLSHWPRYRELSESDVHKVDGMLNTWREWKYAAARL